MAGRRLAAVLAALLAAAALTLLAVGIGSIVTHRDPTSCEMTYMHPSYIPIPFEPRSKRAGPPYQLYLYREGGAEQPTEPVWQRPCLPTVRKRAVLTCARAPPLTSSFLASQVGQPVLFLPGSAGSFRQVRSIASVTARLELEQGIRDSALRYDFYSVDFNEEFTALHGVSVLEQAAFLNDAVDHLLSHVYQSAAGALCGGHGVQPW